MTGNYHHKCNDFLLISKIDFEKVLVKISSDCSEHLIINVRIKPFLTYSRRCWHEQIMCVLLGKSFNDRVL